MESVYGALMILGVVFAFFLIRVVLADCGALLSGGMLTVICFLSGLALVYWGISLNARAVGGLLVFVGSVALVMGGVGLYAFFHGD